MIATMTKIVLVTSNVALHMAKDNAHILIIQEELASQAVLSASLLDRKTNVLRCKHNAKVKISSIVI